MDEEKDQWLIPYKLMDGIRDQGKYRMVNKGCILEQWSQQKSDFGIFKDKWTKMTHVRDKGNNVNI